MNKSIILFLLSWITVSAEAQTSATVSNRTLREALDLFIREYEGMTRDDGDKLKSTDVIFIHVYGLNDDCFLLKRSSSIVRGRMNSLDSLRGDFRFSIYRGAFPVWNDQPMYNIPSSYFKYGSMYVFLYTGFESLIAVDLKDRNEFAAFVKKTFRIKPHKSLGHSGSFILTWLLHIDESSEQKIVIERMEHVESN